MAVQPAERLAKKVLLIGWDSADWKLMQPLMDAGHMPALTSLVEQGVMGNLSTLKPILSPILWNSIATGKRADKHGILGFVEPNPEGSGIRTVASTSRKCKAIWNILTQCGMKTNVVGWYASHPAEPIDGVCVTEHFGHFNKQQRDNPPPPQSVHPAELTESLLDLRVRPWEIGPQHLAPIIPKIGEIPDEKASKIGGARKMLARCSTIHAVATELIEHHPWDLTAVYYETLDHFGHGFMEFHPPRQPHVSEQEFEWYKDVMNGIYMFHDLMLGRLLALAGPETTVMLVSDHGFYSDHLRPVEIPGGPPIGPEAWHRHHGVFVMKGPGVQKDERVYGASILDITPTILTMLGLPVGQDMDGKVLAQCFAQPIQIKRIESWESEPGSAGTHPPDMQSDPFEQQQAVQQLIELGYLSAPTQDATKLIELATKESRFNLAMVHSGAGNFDKAVPILEKLVADYPEESRFALSLAQCHLMMKRLPDARRLIESIKTDGLASAQLDLMRGTLEFAEGRRDDALKTLLRAEAAEPRMPYLHTQIGNVYLQQRRWDEAKRAFDKALTIDGDAPQAHYGLGIVAFHQDRYEDAADLFLRAVGLMHYFPRAHFALGMTLARMGWHDRAVNALKVALAQAPHFVSAHRLLVVCYNRLGLPDQAIVHRQMVQKILAAQKGVGVATAEINRHRSHMAGHSSNYSLSHLDELEAESIHIIREVAAESQNPVMLYSIGKDSSVMVRLAMKAFHPGRLPFPLMHIDTTWKFREMTTFRDRFCRENGLELIVYTNQDAVREGINPFDHGSNKYTAIMKTQALKDALTKHNFDAAFGGARRDEEKSRAKERIYSFRDRQHQWDPKNQRPELWNICNGKVNTGESIRVFPLSNWTELDVWQYIERDNISVVPLYFSAPRPIVMRDGTMIMVDDERMRLNEGEHPEMRIVRFRTLGCYPLTGAINSQANSVADIIQELIAERNSERQGRVIDHDEAASMEQKKREGYF